MKLTPTLLHFEPILSAILSLSVNSFIFRMCDRVNLGQSDGYPLDEGAEDHRQRAGRGDQGGENEVPLPT